MVASEETSLLAKPEREKGHLSVDYTCMKWLSLERKVLTFSSIFDCFCSCLTRGKN